MKWQQWIGGICAGVLLTVLCGGCNHTPEGGTSSGGATAPSIEKPTESPVSEFKYIVSPAGEVNIYEYTGSDSEVVIPETIEGHPVTIIGDMMFKNNKTLTSVVIPSTVEHIGDAAFLECTALTSIRLPINIRSFGQTTFEGCTSLREVWFEGDALDLYQDLFPSAPPELTFYYREDASGWTSPIWKGHNTATWVSPYTNPPKTVFSDENFQYEINDGEVTIVRCNGESGRNRDVVVPETIRGYPVTTIGPGAFMRCDFLSSVTIPDSVTSIGRAAFGACGPMTTLTIPDSVTSIDALAFANSDCLTTVVLPNNLTTIKSNMFEDCQGLVSLTIPDSVTSIDALAFANCTSLTSVVLPDDLISIGPGAFSGCKAITSITLPDSVTILEDYLFEKCTSLASVRLPEKLQTISSFCFRGCTSLSSIQISDNVTNIEYAAFSNSGLTSIIIPERVTSIGNAAFDFCKVLKEAKFQGDSPSDFGKNVFGEVPSDFKILYHEGRAGWTSPQWNGYLTAVW